MRILGLLFLPVFFNVYAAEPIGEPVDIHPLLVKPEAEPVSITLTLDPESIPPELAHLLKFLKSDGIQCEVSHSEPEIVSQIWKELTAEFNDHSYLYQSKNNGKPFRILSLDGGGIRGLITCIFLSHLTHITGKPVHELFDMIVATSTGTLLAAGLGTKKSGNTVTIQPDYSLLPYKDSIPSPYYSPEELAALYLTDGKTIFSGSGWLGQWSGPKYSDTGLNSVLLKYFKDELMSDLGIPVVLTAYDLHKRTLHPFCSFGDNDVCHGIFVREALRTCVAAPTFFTPSMVLKDIYCDGGIVKNNPASLGIAVAADHFGVEPTRVSLLSLGCGHCVDAKSLSFYQNIGIKGWADELLSGVLDGQADHEIIYTLHKSGVGPMHYLRISPLMDTAFMTTDDTTQSNFKGLSSAAISEINRRHKDFSRLAERLTGEKPKDLKPDTYPVTIKALPLSLLPSQTDSIPDLSSGTHPLIQQSLSSPALLSLGQPQQSQTELEVLGDESTPLAPELDQPRS